LHLPGADAQRQRGIDLLTLEAEQDLAVAFLGELDHRPQFGPVPQAHLAHQARPRRQGQFALAPADGALDLVVLARVGREVVSHSAKKRVMSTCVSWSGTFQSEATTVRAPASWKARRRPMTPSPTWT